MNRKVAQSTLGDRRSGILLHLTSLPGKFFNGDLGSESYKFVDYLVAAGQSWWQMLPVNPIGDGDSPYSSISACAGEPLFIDLEDLVVQGLLCREELRAPKGGAINLVDYDKAKLFRYRLLDLAYERAREEGYFKRASFRRFREKERYWLRDYALFGAIAKKTGSSKWSTWEAKLRQREAGALRKAEIELAKEVQYFEFLQFVFHMQWLKLSKYAHSRGITLIGDMPIFVGFNSADVWSSPQSFCMTRDMRPALVAGVPPDRYCKDGQLWGNALYNWDYLKKCNFTWWVNRIRRQLDLFDAIRLDHFIGFNRHWAIPAGAKTAKTGRWVKVPGEQFFKFLQAKLGKLPFIAEDLGLVTADVWQLRDKYEFPGIRVVQFGFGEVGDAAYHAPHTYVENSVVYSGCHDNETTAGWHQGLRGKLRQRVERYFAHTGKDFHWNVIHALQGSVAKLCIIPAQDLLGLDNRDRMNIPGEGKGQWRWRLKKGELTAAIAKRLREQTEVFGRI